MEQEKIGRFISNLRKEKNMTQTELADKLGITDRAISKWENGRGLPDLSLMKPLCDELGITINELLSGEKLKKENYQEKSEENIVNTIAYTNKKINQKNNCLGTILIIFGFIIMLTAVSIFPSESIWSSIYSVFGTIIALIGFSYFSKKLEYSKRLVLNFLFYISFLIILFTLDFINVKMNNQAPRFTKEKITVEQIILYDTPFYDVYRCNTNLENEYWIIEKNSDYDSKTIAKRCK